MSEPTAAKLSALQSQLGRVILGKPEAIEHVLVALVAGHHLLMEDVPGVGKTTLAKALARCFSGAFRRVQFTPDLLPSDILGSSVYNPRDGGFTFKEGPVFANVVLADEINRASPRTQSALLEAMSEGQVSSEGTTRALPTPFLVLATQNPVEFHGTYPLPEAQLDRFGLRIPPRRPRVGRARVGRGVGPRCGLDRGGPDSAGAVRERAGARGRLRPSLAPRAGRTGLGVEPASGPRPGGVPRLAGPGARVRGRPRPP